MQERRVITIFYLKKKFIYKVILVLPAGARNR